MLNRRFGSLVIASIILCDVGCWLVVTGASGAWLVALAGIAAFAGSMTLRVREFGDINDQIGDALSYAAGLFLTIPVVMLLPLVHVGRYSRFGGWLTLAVDGSIAVYCAFAFGIVGAALAAGAALMRRLARIAGVVHDAPAVDTTRPLEPTREVETTREVVARALSTRFEDDAAVRIATIGDSEFRAICDRAAWYRKNPPIPPRSGRSIPFETALALAAVEVLEGAPRSLRRKRDRPNHSADG